MHAPLQVVCGTRQVPYQGQVLDFGAPFRRATMHDLVRDATGVDFGRFGTDLEVGPRGRRPGGGLCALARGCGSCLLSS